MFNRLAIVSTIGLLWAGAALAADPVPEPDLACRVGCKTVDALEEANKYVPALVRPSTDQVIQDVRKAAESYGCDGNPCPKRDE